MLDNLQINEIEFNKKIKIFFSIIFIIYLLLIISIQIFIRFCTIIIIYGICKNILLINNSGNFIKFPIETIVVQLCKSGSLHLVRHHSTHAILQFTPSAKHLYKHCFLDVSKNNYLTSQITPVEFFLKDVFCGQKSTIHATLTTTTHTLGTPNISLGIKQNLNNKKTLIHQYVAAKHLIAKPENLK